MRIFVDLGAYIGDTIELALKRYKEFDRFYAFEPLNKNFIELSKKYGNKRNIVLINAAADVKSGVDELYLGDTYGDIGGSLLHNNIGCFKNKFKIVKTMDFSSFIMSNFSKDDKIVLKIDIEGKEYELLGKMMMDGSIKYIKEIFCEWHYD